MMMSTVDLKRNVVEFESEQESSGSSEEFDSPKSVWKFQSKLDHRIVHHQVLKIREEDLHIGDGIGEGCLSNREKNKAGFVGFRSSRSYDSLISLPSSPLSGKTVIRSCH
ncbi:hypothetical protein GIB67_033084 [Kingdonia uniflora]|uniref:Uncharacterized protein n=1 Tax=Kingdonia uniflora TaxID=39325 RepID=A0A7J7MYY3_9MAGN|nr:hypothetical protein GIB67_033084 [Kingdonia uniflora]